jgi:hypothetical protein
MDTMQTLNEKTLRLNNRGSDDYKILVAAKKSAQTGKR